ERVPHVHPRRRGGAGGEREQHAHGHQDRGRAEQPAVGGPPPHAQRGAVAAGEGVGVGRRRHAVAPRAGWILRASTAARNASPRASKSANWSNEAHAGDSSTTASRPEAAASAYAWAVAASSVRLTTVFALPFSTPAKSSAASPIR